MGLFASTLVFLVIMWCLGYSLSKLLKKEYDLIEINIMRFGMGFAGFAVLTVIIGTIGLALDIWLFLGLSILIASVTKLIPMFTSKKESSDFKFPKMKLKKSHLIYLLLFIMFGITLYMYTTGANAYPYLEDDDPWAHAMGAKYVSIEKNFNDAGIEEGYPFGHNFYINPYPPAYDVLLGLLLQVHNSVPQVIKFTNALLISMSILFMFFLARNLLKSDVKAIIATFILFANPSFMSHFIWALSMNVPIGITLLYILTKHNTFSFKEKEPLLLISIIVAAMTFIQPSSAIKFLILVGLFWVARWIIKKKADVPLLTALIVGGIIALLWWGPHLGNYLDSTSPAGIAEGAKAGFVERVTSYFNPDSGSATRPYTFDDFFVAKKTNMINNPFGWGIGITLLLILGLLITIYYATKNQYFIWITIVVVGLTLIFKFVFPQYPSFAVGVILACVAAIAVWATKSKNEKFEWVLPVLLWFLFTFMIVNSATFRTPGFFSFRTWMFMAIPVAILCAEAIYFIGLFIKGIGKSFNTKIPLSTIVILLLVLVYFTAFPAKYTVNTAFWGPGGSFQAIEEAIGYSWISTLPTDTKVFALCPERPRNKELPGFEDAKVIGFGGFSCGWCQDVIDYREIAFNDTPENLNNWLKSKGYEYMTSDLLCVKEFGANATGTKLTSYIKSGLFELAYAYPPPPNNQPLFFVFKVN